MTTIGGAMEMQRIPRGKHTYEGETRVSRGDSERGRKSCSKNKWQEMTGRMDGWTNGQTKATPRLLMK